MASRSFQDRGGNDAEYEIYKALYSTGRKEPADFVFDPPESDLSFIVFNPYIGIRVGAERAVDRFLYAATDAPEIVYINPNEALSDGRGALLSAIGG